MTKRLTSEREDVIRESNEQDRWTTEQRQIVVRDLLAELDAVRGERDERESLLGAYETAVGDVNTATDLRAKVAALREVLESERAGARDMDAARQRLQKELDWERAKRLVEATVYMNPYRNVATAFDRIKGEFLTDADVERVGE